MQSASMDWKMRSLSISCSGWLESTHFFAVRGDVAEVAVGEADDEVAVPEETVVDDAAVLGFEDELEGLFGGLEVVEQDVPLADDAAERLLLLVLFAVLDLELRPADFLDLEAEV